MMEPHQERVVAEKAELDKKARALSQFIGNSPVFDTLDLAEQGRLREQNDVMWRYSEILGARIAAFSDSAEFWKWWDSSGWNGQADSDPAKDAWDAARLAEREACKRVADDEADRWLDDEAIGACRNIARSIGERFNEELTGDGQAQLDRRPG
jgi:hypothetical protein